MSQRAGYVYILTNRRRGTLYIGVTSDLERRLLEHDQGTGSVFAQKYGLRRLVHVGCSESIVAAIEREKQLKARKRAWKIALIEARNPEWRDLREDFDLFLPADLDPSS